MYFVQSEKIINHMCYYDFRHVQSLNQFIKTTRTGNSTCDFTILTCTLVAHKLLFYSVKLLVKYVVNFFIIELGHFNRSHYFSNAVNI